jgi:hypothetical protein
MTRLICVNHGKGLSRYSDVMNWRDMTGVAAGVSSVTSGLIFRELRRATNLAVAAGGKQQAREKAADNTA